MNYFDKLIYWWDRNIVRASFVAIVYVAMLTVEHGFLIANIWLFINLMWSSCLNPAWRHTFGMMDWYRMPKAAYANVQDLFDIKVYELEINDEIKWACEVWDIDDLSDPIYIDYDNTRAEACVKAYRWLVKNRSF